MERYDYFLALAGVSLAHFADAQHQKFLGRFVEALLDFEREGLRDAAVYDVQEVDVGLFFAHLDVVDVGVRNHAAHDLALAAIVLQHEVFALECLGLLEPQFSGQLLHLVAHVLLYFAGVSLQYFLGFVNPSHVFLVG